MCMKTVCDNKGTGVSKASLFDLLSREDHAAVGDPPDQQRVACLGRLQPLTVLSSQCKLASAILPSRVWRQAGERYLW